MLSRQRIIPLLIFLLAFAYYAALSAKEFTWVFVSGDSGDWLAASRWWFVPQPLGSPLYVLAGHLLNLLPGSLVIWMTLLLSALPSAVTVMLAYLITLRLTANIKLATTASVVLSGAAVFLTQATVLEEYALAAMFLTLAYMFYLQGHKRLCLMALGFGTAVHIAILPVTLLWLIVERQDWQAWLKASWIYVLCGVVPYLMIPALMLLESPPLIAGYFSIGNLWNYISNTSGLIVGTMSVYDLPLRLVTLAGLLAVSLGLGLLALPAVLRKPTGRRTWLLIVTAGFFIWYYATSLDPSTWTFLTFALPSLAILCVLGLRARPQYTTVTLAVALLLVFANAGTLNADVLTRQHPLARQIEAAYRELPEGSIVIYPNGAYSLALFNVMSSGRPDLAPVMWHYRYEDSYTDYGDWLAAEHRVTGHDILAIVSEALESHRSVYIVNDIGNLEGKEGPDSWKELVNRLQTRGSGEVREIAGIIPYWLVW